MLISVRVTSMRSASGTRDSRALGQGDRTVAAAAAAAAAAHRDSVAVQRRTSTAVRAN